MSFCWCRNCISFPDHSHIITYSIYNDNDMKNLYFTCDLICYGHWKHWDSIRGGNDLIVVNYCCFELWTSTKCGLELG